MKIVLCDDDIHFLSMLREKLEVYLENKGLQYEIMTYTSGTAILKENNYQFDLIFLDCYMPKLDGLEVARILRERNPNFVLVFVSAFTDHAPDSHLLNARRYLCKDRLDSTLEEAMEAVIEEMGLCKVEVSFEFVGLGQRSLFVENLIYLESEKHVVSFHIAGERERWRHYGTLDMIESMLPEETFYRIHKSYLVNREYLKFVGNYKALLKNGVVLPISQPRFKEVKKTFLMYRGMP